jgi:hypothetical protein
MKFSPGKVAVAFVSLAMFTTAVALAQTSSTPSRPKRNSAPSGGVMGGFVYAGPAGIHAITGEPFSVEEESERSQVLADGTHVNQTTQTHLYRDSQGRTRSELVPGQLQDGGHRTQIVQIHDPVAHIRYMLDLSRQVARRYELPAPGQNRTPVTAPNETADQQPPAAVEHAPISSATEPADQAGQTQAGQTKVTHVSLGKQTFEGIEARGLQTTTIIPVGAAGNDREIEIVCETWESRELRLTMLSKCTDPLHGDQSRRVVGIDRSEPDPSLFQVPPNFRIEDAPNQAAPDTSASTEK